MAKFSFNLNSLKFRGNNLFKNLQRIFFAMFVLLLIMEVLEIKTSVSFLLSSKQTAAQTSVTSDHTDSLDFNGYNQAVNRINSAASFVPSGGVAYDPFNGIAINEPKPVSTSTPPVISTSTPAK